MLLGDVSAIGSADDSSDGLTAFMEGINSEAPSDPKAIISTKIANAKQFLTDFVVARVTAIRGYFDEIFVRKIHGESICVKKTDGSEICIDGDGLQDMLNDSTSSGSSSVIDSVEVVETIEPVIVDEVLLEEVPESEIVEDEPYIDLIPEPDLASDPEPIIESEVIIEPESDEDSL